MRGKVPITRMPTQAEYECGVRALLNAATWRREYISIEEAKRLASRPRVVRWVDPEPYELATPTPERKA